MDAAESKRYALIACAVLSRECYFCAAQSSNLIDVVIVEQGLHDIGEKKMSAGLQDQIDAIDTTQYEAILLGYGLCNNGIRGLHADLPLVIPRAHDCITLLMGSRQAYLDFFNQNPGCFYRSVGWCEQARSSLSNPESTTSEMGMSTYREYVEKYGEENAQYLMETIGNWYRHYKKMAFIDTGVGNTDDCREKAKLEAAEYGREFQDIRGSVHILQKLMNGRWDEDFLIVQPGKTIAASQNDSIIKIADSGNSEQGTVNREQ